MTTAAVEKQERPGGRLRDIHVQCLVEDMAAALGLDPAGEYSESELVKAALALRARPPLLDLRTYDAADTFMSGLIASSRMLEDRGDRCHIARSSAMRSSR
ncbi:MAG TPA: hypothetical protein VKH19_07560 [Gemmatimonadaceae bacterium]|nr:hypothetical protein [Gemmatimonadaceae bacterium]